MRNEREKKQDISPAAQCCLTHGGCVGFLQGMLAGQGHLGGRRIGPIALEEAAKCYGKAQHHDLQSEERTWSPSIPRCTEQTCRPATPGRSGKTTLLCQASRPHPGQSLSYHRRETASERAVVPPALSTWTWQAGEKLEPGEWAELVMVLFIWETHHKACASLRASQLAGARNLAHHQSLKLLQLLQESSANITNQNHEERLRDERECLSVISTPGSREAPVALCLNQNTVPRKRFL